MMDPTWTVEHPHRNVVNVRVKVPDCRGWSMRFLLRSDAHHDNPRTDWALERRHLDEAKECGAGIIDAGDLHCAMQGKFDKRADKSACRAEHQVDNYLDALTTTAADFYAPYARNWIVMGKGNHETAILKRHETDLTQRTVAILNSEHGGNIQCGGYSGYVRFFFHIRKNHRVSALLYYYHGSGGGGPVTRGVIDTARLSVISPDANVILSGHTHDSWVLPISRNRLTKAGVPYNDEQIHVRTPGYKEAWGDGHDGFEVEKRLGPKPLGAAWLKFWFDCNADKLRYDACRAV